MKSLLRDAIIEAHASKVLRERLYFGLRLIMLFSENTKPVLAFKYTYVDTSVSRQSDTESGDFASDSEADSNEKYELVVALALVFDHYSLPDVKKIQPKKTVKTNYWRAKCGISTRIFRMK